MYMRACVCVCVRACVCVCVCVCVFLHATMHGCDIYRILEREEGWAKRREESMEEKKRQLGRERGRPTSSTWSPKLLAGTCRYLKRQGISPIRSS